MLNNYIENLENSIQWAQHEEDFDVLCLAKQHMDQLMDFVSLLPANDQQKVQRRIDNVLPMEWPLWMEACRYGDSEQLGSSQPVFH